MAEDATPARATGEAAREARRKALLKSNMGRRKAQTRARAAAAGEDGAARPPAETTDE